MSADGNEDLEWGDRLELERKELVRKALGGDKEALERLLRPYRPRLAYAISLRTSEVELSCEELVELALAEAGRRLGEYLKERPLPFYVWLRAVAFEKLFESGKRRARTRAKLPMEVRGRYPSLSAHVIPYLVSQLLFGRGECVKEQITQQVIKKVSSAILQLNETDREILILRHLEQLNAREAAAAIGIEEGKLKTRHLQTLKKISEVLTSALNRDE